MKFSPLGRSVAMVALAAQESEEETWNQRKNSCKSFVKR